MKDDVLTVFRWLIESWNIKKKDIKEMGINPDKEYDTLMLSELIEIAFFLDVRVSDLFD